jgi:hypothetical protein
MISSSAGPPGPVREVEMPFLGLGVGELLPLGRRLSRVGLPWWGLLDPTYLDLAPFTLRVLRSSTVPSADDANDLLGPFLRNRAM